jgi:uncharacterized protein YfdQ (DUF2303 family)
MTATGNYTELSTIAATGDVAAALDAAQDLAIELADENDALVVAHRLDVVLEHIDTEKYQPTPTRQRGTVKALTAEGFVKAFQHRTVDETQATVYADHGHTTLVAVLNDDEAENPGWRDHRITFTPELTPEWQHWVNHQGLTDQAKFAQALEDGEFEIREPSATRMLDLAQTFQASTSARFKVAGRLKDGRTQLVYEEEIDAKAGGEGMVDIPDTFTIEVRPFYGAEPKLVTCRLRYRLGGGHLAIGYTIVRPDDVIRDAFADVVGFVIDELAGWPLVEGVPAQPVTPGR